MKSTTIKAIALVASGFVMGVGAMSIPIVNASPNPISIVPSQKEFLVSVDEVRQNFVFAENFKGSYNKSFTLSDGTVRDIELTPMLKDGKLLVAFKDTGGQFSYMGPNGTTTNGKLMVSLTDVDVMQKNFETLIKQKKAAK